MNIAVNTLRNTHVDEPSFSEIVTTETMLVVALIVAVLLSALSVVYIKDLNRRLFNELQTTQKIRDDLHVEWGQLLLEQSAWSTQARIQQLAHEQLQMEVVNSRDLKLIRP